MFGNDLQTFVKSHASRLNWASTNERQKENQQTIAILDKQISFHSSQLNWEMFFYFSNDLSFLTIGSCKNKHIRKDSIS